MIRLNNKSDCCACTACANICSHQAITMQPDGLGFLYPVVDSDKCVDCGLCENVCAFNDHYSKELNLKEPDVYAVRHKNIQEIEQSRSGAMFVAVSDWILDNGGIVYGVGYADHFRVVHKRASTKEERDEFRGSKYVQSDLNTTFVQVKNDLKKGLHVLFSGTPCQTSGLRSYLSLLRVDMNKLYVIDIVCHGVPSPYFWRDYLSYVECKQGMKAVAVNFRDKSKSGWASHKESFTFENGVVYTFAFTFYQHIMFRHSCGVCHFTNFQRPSDITIADFWGWERVDPIFNEDDKGVSLVLLNSEKGRRLFHQVKGELDYIPTDMEHCIQPNLEHPTVIHPKRDAFERDYVKYGFVYVGKKYGDMGWRNRANRLLKTVENVLKNRIRRIVKI